MSHIPMFYPFVAEQAIENVTDVLRSRWIGEGPKVKQFEDALSERFGFRFCVALNSGTAALRLALAMAGVGPGDEVLSSAMTCTASNTAILEQFATPVFADIQYWTGNLDPGDIEHRITGKTKAILVVHWAGYPCDLAEIHEVADKYGLPVIEDGAHALGATYRGAPIGRVSTYTMFSLQAIKQLTTGDGGLLCLQTEDAYDEAMRRRWFGIDRRRRRVGLNGYAHWPQSEVGYKMQMNDIAAAIGLGNLTEIDWILGRRDQIVGRYLAELEGVSGVHLFHREDDRKSGNWLFTMHVDDRDGFCRMMRDADIEVSVCHIRNDVHPIFGPRRDDLPNLDLYESSYISIPLNNHLADDDVDRIIGAIHRGW